MDRYITVVFCVCICSSLLIALSPSDKAREYQKYLSALCIICVTITPIKDAVIYIRELDLDLHISSDEYMNEYESIFNGYMDEYSEETTIEIVKDQLKDVFAIEPKDLNVEVDSTNGSVYLKRIYILLGREYIFKDTARIETYFKNLFKCEVLVAID